MQPLRFFILPKFGKAFFRRFSVFPMFGQPFSSIFLFFPSLGNPIFHIFSSSQSWESIFRCFLLFPREGKLIFADFWFSLAGEIRFSLFPCSSYPYESFFCLFFVDCTPYLNSFSRKSTIYCRIWTEFPEN